jgi:KDO2-lipid IV(A) lauroyltransferase
MRAVLAAGTLLGRAFYAFDAGHRRLAMSNLHAAFPIRSRAECRAVARDMFAHFGRLLTVLLKFSTMGPDQMLRHVDFEGQERVAAAHAQGRGVLLFTGHFGFWEINALVHALVIRPMAVLARPLDNPLLHNLLESVRTSTGNSVIYRRGAIRRVLRALGDNQAVAVLIDQHMQSADAIYVDFFNRPAATTSALAALALRTGAPVVPVFALPQPRGRFRMVYEHPVEPPRGEDPDAIREFTQRCTDVLEMYVRRYPELWLWMHRRWRDVEVAEVGGMFPEAQSDEGQ